MAQALNTAWKSRKPQYGADSIFCKVFLPNFYSQP